MDVRGAVRLTIGATRWSDDNDEDEDDDGHGDDDGDDDDDDDDGGDGDDDGDDDDDELGETYYWCNKVVGGWDYCSPR